jgi:CheY-like chemotaxis protein
METERVARATVLIIEGSIDSRLLISLSLQHAGYFVLTATTSEEAMQIAKHALPDLILMDLDLPQRGGFAATRRLRQTTELRNVPVVAATVHDTEGVKQAALDVGCSGYITKPMDYEKLDYILSRVLTGVAPGQLIEGQTDEVEK